MFHTLGEMKNRVAQSDEERESPERIAGEKRVLARGSRRDRDTRGSGLNYAFSTKRMIEN